jgi:zinc D-Ala-D-Ala carboxypeptidase
MKILLYILIFLLLVTVLGYYFLTDISSYKHLNFLQRYAASSALETFDLYLEEENPDKRSLIDYDTLIAELGFIEKTFVKKLFSIHPSEFGFKGPFYSKERPARLVKINSVMLDSGRGTGIQYLPVHVYNDYLRLAEQMKNDIGRTLFVDSGYRSPGRQAYLFIYYLVTSSDYSLKENVRWITMPGYSEHGHPVNTAVDFASQDGINGFSEGQTASDFTSLPEYEWLLKNASDFNFHLSYPEGNPAGVAFEPWHWHWERKIIREL